MNLDGMVKVIAEALHSAQVLRLDSNEVYVFSVSSDDEDYRGMLRDHAPFEAVPYTTDEW
jgi:hypothetical protein